MNVRTYAHACNFTNARDNGLQISSETKGFTKNGVDTPEAKPCLPFCNVIILIQPYIRFAILASSNFQVPKENTSQM